MDKKSLLKNISIVLNCPKIPENIGAAARAAYNMGIDRLIAVAPENPDLDRMLKMATHKAAHLIKEMKVYPDLKEALSNFNYVIGTTARTGGIRKPIFTPRELAASLIQFAPHNQIALVFGAEDRGLTNEEIRLCHQLVKIPTAEFSSLNLAQAVMVICYEIYLASFKPPEKMSSPLANSHELELMYEKVKDILLKISFIHPGNPDHWMMNIRRFFSRITLRTDEVNLIMGICRQIDWFGKSRSQSQGESSGQKKRA